VSGSDVSSRPRGGLTIDDGKHASRHRGMDDRRDVLSSDFVMHWMLQLQRIST
jgi:hypothetical protein